MRARVFCLPSQVRPALGQIGAGRLLAAVFATTLNLAACGGGTSEAAGSTVTQVAAGATPGGAANGATSGSSNGSSSGAGQPVVQTPPVVVAPPVVLTPPPAVVTPPVVAAPPVVRTLSCDGDLHLTNPTGVILFNNVWNSIAAGIRAWSQCLLSRTDSHGVAQYGWKWSWPALGGALFAYPEVFVGAKPWETGPGNDARFPFRLANANTLNLRFSAETATTGSHNLAASIWLISTPQVAAPPVFSDIKAEVMIWTDYTDDMVADPGTTTKRGEFTDANGLQWVVWADENWGDASNGASNRWTYIAYHLKPSQRRTSANIDALAILKHAASLGLISTSLYVADVELGNELVSGQGETWLTDFTVRVN
jgi:hypothetical protein